MGGILGGAGAALALSKGGKVPKMSDGGLPDIPSADSFAMPQIGGQFASTPATPSLLGSPDTSSSLKSKAGKFLQGMGGQMQSGSDPQTALAQMVALGRAHGGKIPKDMKRGGNVPGQARFSGDTEKNDTVPAMLSPGEVVIPRSIVNSPDAPERSARFVSATLGHRGGLRRR